MSSIARRWALAGLIVAQAALAQGPAAPAAPLTEEQILAQADARIQKYRTRQVGLKLTGPNGQALEPGSTVRVEQTRHEFLFGCNIFVLGRLKTPADNAAYEKHFAELLNYATLPFYWWGYEAKQGQPDHARTGEIIRWCRRHKVTCKGHPLAWAFHDPKWLPDDLDKVLSLQLGRIEACTSRFRDDILYWDVVNEATHYDRPDCKQNAPKLTAVIERMGVGPFVRQCFQAARRGSPKAHLIINDYRTDQAYIDKVLKELVDEAGRPMYDVIGIQCHQHGGAWSAKQTWEICERFAGFGKPLHFTEATILSGQPGWELKAKAPEAKWESTPEGERRQAAEVARFYTVLFSHPAVEAITWWDFTDQRAWQGAPARLLRADLTPKPAYDELHRLVKGKWWTRLEARTGPGPLSLRGFFGDYRVRATVGGRELVGTFSLSRTAPATIEVGLK